MNTEFEVVIAQSGVDHARTPRCCCSFAEVDRLEEELSRFKPTSHIRGSAC